MSKKDEAKYLSDMLEYARKALVVRADADRARFDADMTLQLALAHLVQIIGEAAYRASDETRAALPSVPWTEIIGMRHRLVHDYGNVNYRVVWDVVENDLPTLITALENFTPPAPPSA